MELVLAVLMELALYCERLVSVSDIRELRPGESQSRLLPR